MLQLAEGQPVHAFLNPKPLIPKLKLLGVSFRLV